MYDIHPAASEGGIIPIMVDFEAVILIFAFFICRYKLCLSQSSAIHAIDVPLRLNQSISPTPTIE